MKEIGLHLLCTVAVVASSEKEKVGSFRFLYLQDFSCAPGLSTAASLTTIIFTTQFDKLTYPADE